MLKTSKLSVTLGTSELGTQALIEVQASKKDQCTFLFYKYVDM